MANPEWHVLSCPLCGYPKLDQVKDNKYHCSSCDSTLVANFGDNGIVLTPILERVVDSANKMTSELAIPRIQKEIKGLRSERSGLITQFEQAQLAIQSGKEIQKERPKTFIEALALLFLGICFMIFIVLLVIGLVDVYLGHTPMSGGIANAETQVLCMFLFCVAPLLLISLFCLKLGGTRLASLSNASAQETKGNQTTHQLGYLVKKIKDVEDEIRSKEEKLEWHYEVVSRVV